VQLAWIGQQPGGRLAPAGEQGRTEDAAAEHEQGPIEHRAQQAAQPADAGQRVGL